MTADSSPARDRLLASILLSLKYFSRSAVLDRLNRVASKVVHKKTSKSAAGSANPESFFCAKNLVIKRPILNLSWRKISISTRARKRVEVKEHSALACII